MSCFLDASVICRYLVNDVPDLAARARNLIKSGDPLWVHPTALLETAYVLHRVLGRTRSEVAGALINFIREPTVHLLGLDYHVALQALIYCANRNCDFGDALLWAVARPGSDVIYTFDRDFPAEGITVREP